jgi:pyrroline-5-carboxylate reductase
MSEIVATKQTVGFIGSGNMAQAIIEGMLDSGFPANQLRVCSPNAHDKIRLQQIGLAQIDNDLENFLAHCDLIIYAAKPQQMSAISSQCSGLSSTANCLVSIAAGVTVDILRSNFPHIQQIIRVMPNTPSLVKSGVAGIYYGEAPNAKPDEVQLIRHTVRLIFESVGDVVELNNESDMDIVTAIAGSGPAYFYLLAEYMITGAVKLGLSADLARRLVEKTLNGSGDLLTSQQEHVESLRKKVTSPGGTTAAAMDHLIENGLEVLVCDAVKKATLRGQALSNTAK